MRLWRWKSIIVSAVSRDLFAVESFYYYFFFLFYAVEQVSLSRDEEDADLRGNEI